MALEIKGVPSIFPNRREGIGAKGKENYATIAANTFTTVSPDVDDITQNNGEWVSDNVGNLEFSANIQIPNGATITKAVLYGTSATPTWILKRFDIRDGGADTVSTQNINTESTAIAEYANNADNQFYVYVFQTVLEINNRIYGARITYTI
jgi:hypothetical protein